ncbi:MULTISPECIES: hypothetical protein [Legionella]|uniref:Uncharacterized protein n=1 Tax=Legionella septentrionalis TaxID=2498109 RepID=A0A3S1CLT1_9GAMM|nr:MULTISPECIES: hypothetical protein [Legionella]MCP0914333.1 hypothetical protein [Legionella sp. 27cVA30]RUQ89005.1 hypothetical protein EKM59_04205 [Legionella septentrionalis]RUR11831.1 hypothetical protein ELY14_00885 [Legionella septentrionalis]
MLNLLASLKSVFWKASAEIPENQLNEIGLSKKKLSTIAEPSSIPLFRVEDKLQQLLEETTQCHAELRHDFSLNNLQYLDKLEKIEKKVLFYAEDKIPVKPLSELFTAKEFLEFEKEFQIAVHRPRSAKFSRYDPRLLTAKEEPNACANLSMQMFNSKKSNL